MVWLQGLLYRLGIGAIQGLKMVDNNFNHQQAHGGTS